MGTSLTRIFHADLLQQLGIMMSRSVDSHFDLGSMAPYSPASQCSSPLSHQTSQLPRHDQHEISGLALWPLCTLWKHGGALAAPCQREWLQWNPLPQHHPRKVSVSYFMEVI